MMETNTNVSKIGLIMMTIFLLSIVENYAQIVNAGADITLCAAGSTRLQGQVSPNVYKYVWTSSANPGYTETSTLTPTVNVSATTTFYLTGYYPGSNRVINGDFESGNTGFDTQYQYAPPGYNALQPPGKYSIVTDAYDCNGAYIHLPDHTRGDGTGHYMAANGASTVVTVWSQIISPIPINTDFIFYAWVLNIENTISYSPRLQFSINRALLGSEYVVSNNMAWSRFYIEWNSGTATSDTIAIKDNATALGGNDFGLDDIYFAPILIKRDTVTVFVEPTAAVYDTVRICQGDTCKFGTQNITQTGNYSEIFRASTGCDSVVNRRVIVSDPTIAAIVTDDSCSVSDKSSIVLSFSNGMAPYSCIWNDGATQTSRYNLDTGTYTATVSDSIGCVATYSATFVKNSLAVSYTVVPAACHSATGSFTLSTTGGFAPYSINWGSITTHNDSTASLLASGEYPISVTSGLCVRSLSIPIPFIPPPIACFTAAYDSHNKAVPVLFANCSQGVTSWHWNFGDGDDATDLNPQHLYADFGTYIVTLVVSYDSTCVDSTSQKIVITDVASCYISNSFTPNNDGINDSFCPICNNIQLYDYHFIIYDRWGNIVFESHTVNEAWDGQIHGKRRASQELYRWVLSYRNESNVPQTRTGYVTIIR